MFITAWLIPWSWLVPEDKPVPFDINQVFLNITHNANIKAVHLHNDYTRDIPLLNALSYGIPSVEADIWAFPAMAGHGGIEGTPGAIDTTEEQNLGWNSELGLHSGNKLYVAHTQPEIKRSWTLELLYLDPIFKLLKESRDKGSFGVFLEDPSQTLYLFIDLKTRAMSTWPLLSQKLQRFIDHGFLSYYDTSTKQWTIGPLTIILTGNLPTEAVLQQSIRYVSLDGDLTQFKLAIDYDISSVSLIASNSMTNILGNGLFEVRPFSDSEKATLKTTFQNSHAAGTKTRIWDGVKWLSALRDSENDDLYELGTDFVNLDDLSLSVRYPRRDLPQQQ